MKLQIKGPGAQQRNILTLEPTTTFANLQKQISDKTGIPVHKQSLLMNFPPREIQCEGSTVLEAIPLKTGETILVKEKEGVASQGVVIQGTGWEYPPTIPRNGSFVVVPMPRDNSCLFHSIALVFASLETSKKSVQALREMIANVIQVDQTKYNGTFLGMPNSVYQSHIMNPDTWGGAIDLSIYSNHYQSEIVAFDYHHLREDVFGEGQGHKRRVFLLYTGDHYDAMVFSQSNSSSDSGAQGLFSSKDTNAWERARTQAEILHSEAAKRGECILQKGWRREIAHRKPKFAPSGGVVGSAPKAEVVSRPNQPSTTAPSTTAPSTAAPSSTGGRSTAGEWACAQCTMLNPPSSFLCTVCGVGENPLPPANPTTTTSTTSTTSSNPGTAAAAARAPVTAPAPSADEPWECPHCTCFNASGLSCVACEKPRPGAPPTASDDYVPPPAERGAPEQLVGSPFDFAMPQPIAPWACAACTTNNPAGAESCTVCSTRNPAVPAQPNQTAMAMEHMAAAQMLSSLMGPPPTWTCTCGRIVASNVVLCPGCRAPSTSPYTRQLLMQQQGGSCSIQ